MKYALNVIVLLVLLLNSSCDSSSHSNNYDDFTMLLRDGYVRKHNNISFILSLKKKSIVCVFNNKPNNVFKKTLDKIFELYSSEFSIIERIDYVDIPKNCSSSTNLYILVHEGDLQKKQLNKVVLSIAKRHKITHQNIFPIVNSMAFGVSFLREGKLVSIIVINQMSKHIGEESVSKRLKSMLIEEFFQSVTQARDIENTYRQKSIIQESVNNNGRTRIVNIKAFNEYSLNNPQGLCGYDLWYLLLKYGHDGDLLYFKDYVIRFNKSFRELKRRALIIKNNPSYKSLFDPRCSGKNTGINTKIGIQ